MTVLISEALNLKSRDMVVCVGGGGKTTIINRLANELLAEGKRLVITTTTKIFVPDNFAESSLVLTSDCRDWCRTVDNNINLYGYALIGQTVNAEGKIIGLSNVEVAELWNDQSIDVILIEGDGAKGKPFKAPRGHEPVIPEAATVVVPVLGVECIDSPLVEELFHAIEQICRLTSLSEGEMVTGESIAQILLHPAGYKKGVPQEAAWVPFINKVENEADAIKALALAYILKKAGTAKIIYGAAKGGSGINILC